MLEKSTVPRISHASTASCHQCRQMPSAHVAAAGVKRFLLLLSGLAARCSPGADSCCCADILILVIVAASVTLVVAVLCAVQNRVRLWRRIKRRERLLANYQGMEDLSEGPASSSQVGPQRPRLPPTGHAVAEA